MRTFLTFFLFTGIAAAQWFSAGLKGGLPATDPFQDITLPGPFTIGQTIHSFSDSKKFIAGGMVEVRLPLGFSVEADGLYRPLRLVIVTTNAGSPAQGKDSRNYESWEVPIVAKYRFLHTPLVKPYAEAGMSFRILEPPYDNVLSHRGDVLGAGIEWRVSRLKISPEIRYTRWGADSNFPIAKSNRNQVELLLGVGF
jgi:hypothetical protein